jgi:hypothetical protein
MLLRTWRLVTIMLTALSMSAAFAHLLEMPAKLRMDGAAWLSLLQTLYPPAFGRVGGVAEIGAVVTAIVLVVLVRSRPRALPCTIVAALCLIATHAAFWIWVAPVNATLLPLTPETLPADWTGLRDQWEYTHAARAVLQIVALGALVWSVLVETPEGTARTTRSSSARAQELRSQERVESPVRQPAPQEHHDARGRRDRVARAWA